MFKKHFLEDYNMIFNETLVDDVIELSKYKMLIYAWTFSSIIKNKNRELIDRYKKESNDEELKKVIFHHSSLFKKKYLTVSQSFNKDYKDWIILDKSVKPMGIVFESESKQECINWIESCEV